MTAATDKTKKDLISLLEEIGLLLELRGDNPFKSRAYYRAARNIESLGPDIDDLLQKGALESVRGIGKALAEKIREYLTTGRLVYYEQLRESIPVGFLEMIRLPGLGPKKIRALHEMLSIQTVGELEYACMENRLVTLPGFGIKTQDKILAVIENFKRYSERHLYSDIIGQAEELKAYVERCRDVLSISIAGSLRRKNDTVKDIDLLVATDAPDSVAGHFLAFPLNESTVAHGPTKISTTLSSGSNSDLRIVTPEQFPYALHHFTGSKDHNTAMRSRAKKYNLKMNEYGLFRESESIPCTSEEELFESLNLSFIPPELREDQGEIEAAETGTIPRLIEESDIRGVLHVHTTASDGSDTLESLAGTAIDMGFQYIGISDHSKSAFYAGGLSVEEIDRQHDRIDELNERLPNIRIFKGIESDILPDGTLDYDNTVLETFDFVIAAVHSHFTMTEAEMTLRIMKALDNPFTTILAHPTGRLLLSREPYRVNMEKVIRHAAERGIIIELNAHPRRLDLDWKLCRFAKNSGVKIAINPDAHDCAGLRDIRFGVNIARKGWLTADDCVNCLDTLAIEQIFFRRNQQIFS